MGHRQSVRNADKTGPDGVTADALDETDYGLSGVATNWGRTADGGESVMSYGVDLLGRRRSMQDQVGRTTFTEIETRGESGRPGVLYLAAVSLPHEIDDTNDVYDRPATITWQNAGGRAIRSSDFTVSDVDGTGLALNGYTIDVTSSGEIARSESEYSLDGSLAESRRYPDVWVSTSLGTPDTTEYTYDERGRLVIVETPNGTRNETVYDVLDRPIQSLVGTTSGNMTLVREMFYDYTGTASSAAHGTADGDAGSGNLTLVREWPDNQTANNRHTVRYYDFRDRLIGVENPLPPHQIMAYDNLDRVTETGLFNDTAMSSWASAPSGVPGPTANRLAYSTTSYSQRGLVWKSETAIDPGNASAGMLAQNRWYDEVGRTIAESAPNAPASESSYDGLGRVEVRTVVAQDPGSHADATNLDNTSNETVLEQTEFTYNATTQLLELVSSYSSMPGTSPANGLLSSTDAIPQYTRFMYDNAGRRVATIAFGTGDSGDAFIDGTSAPAEPSIDPTTPSGVDSAVTTANGADWLAEFTQYNARGLVHRTRRPRGGPVTATNLPDGPVTAANMNDSQDLVVFYDDLSRRIATVENAVELVDEGDIQWGSGLTPNRWTVTDMNWDDARQDRDRVTSFVYDASGNLKLQVAHIPTSSGEDVQITEYVYGVITATSGIASNDLLAKVGYPNESTGLPGTGTAVYEVTYTYNRLGELTSMTDQNETVHDYVRDDLGRVLTDTADFTSTNQASLDESVTQLRFAYDDLARLELAETLDDSGTPAVINAVQFGYTPLGQIAEVRQNHDGTIQNDLTDHLVTYDYEDSSTDNHSRLKGITYPNEHRLIDANGSIDSTDLPYTVEYTYGAASTTDDLISRVTEISIHQVDNISTPTVTETPIATYDHVGLSRIYKVIHHADPSLPDLTLNYAVSPGGSTSTDGLVALDRFGRVMEQMWTTPGFAAGTGGLPNQPALVHRSYDYDRLSNRTMNLDGRPGAQLAGRDRVYWYDGLSRIGRASRGVLDSGTWTSAEGDRLWELDTLGNWDSIGIDSGTDGSFSVEETFTRNHNAANEVTQFSDPIPSTSPQQYTLSSPIHDNNGNFRGRANRNPSHRYRYDAWNRLVQIHQVAPSTTVYGEYEYNALHWRIRRRFDSGDGATNPGLTAESQEREYIYSASWQILEEHVDLGGAGTTGDPTDPADQYDGTVNRVSQNYWGVRYIDDYVSKRIDRAPASTGESELARTFDDGTTASNRYVFLTDAQFSVVATVDHTGGLIDRVSYSPYGVPEHRYAADVDGDGSVDADDVNLIFPASIALDEIGDAGYNADYDLDGPDGIVDSDDYSAFAGEYARTYTLAAMPSGWIADPGDETGPDNSIGYCGYVTDTEAGARNAVRFRYYDPWMGRWLTRDPAGTVDGMNQIQYGISNPTRFVDPAGLTTQPVPDGMPRDLYDPLAYPPYYWQPQTPSVPNGNQGLSPPFIPNPVSASCTVELRCNQVTRARRVPIGARPGSVVIPALHHCYIVITNPDGSLTEVRGGPRDTGFSSANSSTSGENPCGCPEDGYNEWGPVVPYIGPHGPNARPDGTSSPDGTKPVVWSSPLTSTGMSGCELANCIMRNVSELGKLCDEYTIFTPFRNSNTIISEAMIECGLVTTGPDGLKPSVNPGVVAPGWGEPWYP